MNSAIHAEQSQPKPRWKRADGAIRRTDKQRRQGGEEPSQPKRQFRAEEAQADGAIGKTDKQRRQGGEEPSQPKRPFRAEEAQADGAIKT